LYLPVPGSTFTTSPKLTSPSKYLYYSYVSNSLTIGDVARRECARRGRATRDGIIPPLLYYRQSVAIMFENPPEAASNLGYEVIFDNALKVYKRKPGGTWLQIKVRTCSNALNFHPCCTTSSVICSLGFPLNPFIPSLRSTCPILGFFCLARWTKT